MNAKVTVDSIFEEEEDGSSEESLPRQPEVDRTNCVVCGDKASGFHYGVYSCEGCKGFFRRSVNRGYVKACRWGNKCSMDLHSRRRCPDCRLRSCKAAGMRPDCLLTQAQCRSKVMWRQRQASKSSSGSKGGSVQSSPLSSQSVASNQSTEENFTFPTVSEIPVTTTSGIQLQPVTTLSNGLQLPVTTSNGLQLPVTTISGLQLPVTTTSGLQLQPVTTLSNGLQLPVTTSSGLQLPVTTMSNGLQLPVTTLSNGPQFPESAVTVTMPFTSSEAADESSSEQLFEELMSSFDVGSINPMFARSDSTGSEDVLSFLALLDNDSELFPAAEPSAVNNASTVQAAATSQIAIVAPLQVEGTSTHTEASPSLQAQQNTAENAVSTNDVPTVHPNDQSPAVFPSDPSINFPVKPDAPAMSQVLDKNVDTPTKDDVPALGRQKSAPEVCGKRKMFVRPGLTEQLAPNHQLLISEVLEYWKANAAFEDKMNQKCYEESLKDGTPDEKRLRTLSDGDASVRRYVSYCKSLRGFNDLNMADQIAVIKGTIFEYGIMRGCTCTEDFGFDKCRQIGLLWYTKEFNNMLFDWYKGMKKLEVDMMTINILCCIIVLAPDRDNIRDRATLEKAQQQYIECLEAYCKVAYPGEPAMFPRLVSKLAEVRSVGAGCEKGMRPECKTMIKTQPTLCEIYNTSSD